MNENARFWLKLGTPAVAFQALVLALRLSGVISWPWWLVSFPAWGSAVLLAAGAVVVFGALGTWGK